MRRTLIVLTCCVAGLALAGCSGTSGVLEARAAEDSGFKVPHSGADHELERLRNESDRLLKTHDFVAVRRDIDVMFELIDKLEENGQEDEILKYLPYALKHNPWALQYQLMYAKILEERGEHEGNARTRACRNG